MISNRTRVIYELIAMVRYVGNAHFTINRILREKAQKLNAGFAVLMPGNDITLSNSTNSEAETTKRLRESILAIRNIAELITNRETVPYAGSASLCKYLKGWWNMFRFTLVYRVPEKFWAPDACDRCDACARICPEHNIAIDADLPVWGKNCQICLACIHWCPKGAVQHGKVTITRKRYHHPDISN